MKINSDPKIQNTIIIISLMILVIGWFLTNRFSQSTPKEHFEVMKSANLQMQTATIVLQEYLEESKLGYTEEGIKNRNPWIGEEFSEITSTEGKLSSKLFSTSPHFAAYLVDLLMDCGAGKGSIVAIGGSGSFPALDAVAVIASEIVGATPVAVFSLSSSNYGANRIDFNLADMFKVLKKNNIINHLPAAYSLGGEGDQGRGLLHESNEMFFKSIGEIPFLKVASLEESISKRMEIYKPENTNNNNSLPCCFINIGGAQANLGKGREVLLLSPGLVDKWPGQHTDNPGVIERMLRLKIPVIHLLNLDGLIPEAGFYPDSPPSDFTIPLYNDKKSPKWIWILSLILAWGLVLCRSRIDWIDGAHLRGGLHLL